MEGVELNDHRTGKGYRATIDKLCCLCMELTNTTGHEKSLAMILQCRNRKRRKLIGFRALALCWESDAQK
jgi:hypothetical protein